MSLPGALLLKPVFLPKVWAAEGIPGPLGRVLAAPAGTGEVWLASHRHHVTPVAAGELAGMGLDQVLERHGEHLLGPGGRSQEFPLLLKVLSVGQWLSVQVHPDDQAARRLEGEPWGKSEAWRVLEAEPGAQIVMGLKPGLDREEVARAVREGRLVELLAKVPARRGDTFHLPAGTVHATGPGLTIFEIQQASDITYRFYDWDRLGSDGKPRELHQEKALQVMRLTGPGAPTPPRVLADGPVRQVLLVEDPHFALLEIQAQEPYLAQWNGRRLRVFFVLRGGGRLEPQGGGYPLEELAPGQCWLVPAGMGPVRLVPGGEGLSVLESVALS